MNRERLKHVWERVKKEITKQDSRIRSELQEIDGKASDVWSWIKSAASSPKKSKSVCSITVNTNRSLLLFFFISAIKRTSWWKWCPYNIRSWSYWIFETTKLFSIWWVCRSWFLRNDILVIFLSGAADDVEIDHVVDSIQNRCAKVKSIEHIGIHSVSLNMLFYIHTNDVL